jgi:hypothetical protein
MILLKGRKNVFITSVQNIYFKNRCKFFNLFPTVIELKSIFIKLEKRNSGCLLGKMLLIIQ